MLIEILQILFFLLVANGSPVLVRKLLSDRFNYPVDGGYCLPDGQPMFGVSKTWRGIISSMLLCGLLAWLLRDDFVLGLMIGLAAMLGDLFSSFIKRRMKMPSSSMAPLLDQIPESLFPSLVLVQYYQLQIEQLIFVVGVFIVLELMLSRLLFRLGIRRRPY